MASKQLLSLIGKLQSQPQQKAQQPQAQVQQPQAVQPQPQQPKQPEFISASDVQAVMAAINNNDADALYKAFNLVGSNAYQAARVDSENSFKDQLKQSELEREDLSMSNEGMDRLMDAIIRDLGITDEKMKTRMLSTVDALLTQNLHSGASLEDAVAATFETASSFIPAQPTTPATSTDSLESKNKDNVNSLFSSDALVYNEIGQLVNSLGDNNSGQAATQQTTDGTAT